MNLDSALIVTILNEEKTIKKFLESVLKQTQFPNELIIVDGGSTDQTVRIINQEKFKFKNKLSIRIFIKKGNRSTGRNFGIKKTKCSNILLSDAGCILDKNWVRNILLPLKKTKADVVSGYYKGKYSNTFEKCLIPFVLVMKDKISKNNFLPSTRSMAMKREVWREIGGFNENFSHNEDYVFANNIIEKKFTIKFAQNAIVYWIPRNSFFSSFKMFFRFSYGDIEAGILRTKVIYLFMRYIVGIYLLTLMPIIKSALLIILTLILVISYALWAVFKNYKYINNPKGILYLPVIQFLSDVAVILGSTTAIFKIYVVNIFYTVFKEKILIFFLISYTLLIFLIFNWGIPNSTHPFCYYMDEWHQSQSIRNLYAKGSPNIEGSANGSIFQFYLTGIYLLPFFLFNIINPLIIKSSVLNLIEQQRLFEVLRFNTYLFGIGSIILFYFISKKFFNINYKLSTFLFIFNPIWIMLSNYYKYDIALIFWILCALFMFLRYTKINSKNTFIFSAIFSSIALSTKLSVQPLFLGLIFNFLLFTKDVKRNIKLLISGITIYMGIFILFGIPDIIFNKGSLYEYLSSNLINGPLRDYENFILPTSIGKYLFIYLYPSIFGYTLYFGLIISIIVLVIFFIFKNKKLIIKNNLSLVVICINLFLFLVSLSILSLGATNNRVLVILPFICLIFSFGYKKIINLSKNNYYKILVRLVLICVLIVQFFQTISWMPLKINDYREISSEWIVKNISKKSSIGIENIPIYQGLPDVIVNDFYLKQYNIKTNIRYNYLIIDKNTKNLPKYIILTNTIIESKLIKHSSKKEILENVIKKNYKEIIQYSPNFQLLNIFTNDREYIMSGLVQSPTSLIIYEKK